ncbi:alpha/beta hydrolase family protein [Azospirillum halopraeferens]|uniref:dipeptidyl-peptidase 5 n=1 Tax=Azospirillum halopraeferens TaxID=34010 RepID=UPI000424671A|nr:S9 family peptidase [Azospirillum halopraeferens]
MTAPYGTWRSPVTARSLAEGGISLRAPWRRGATIMWLEGRPTEGGRTVPVRRSPDGTVADLPGAGWDIRGRVHEYGGGDLLHLDDPLGRPALAFCSGADQALYVTLADAGDPVALTVPGRDRFADLRHDAARRRLIAVRERHPADGHGDPENALVAVPLDAAAGPSDGGTVLAAGADFYAGPCVAPDGNRLAYVTWNHPDMPWDGTELWVAALDATGALGDPVRVAGGRTESVVQPVWLPDGRLVYVSDRSGWWNLYVWDGTASRAVLPMAAEFAYPPWVFGLRDVAVVDGRTLACVHSRDGIRALGLVDVETGALRPLDLPFTEIGDLHADGRTLTFCAAGPATPNAVVTLDLDTGAVETVRSSVAVLPDPAYVSTARAIRFPTGDGAEAHAFYYPPVNPDAAAPPDERPPLIVRSHGGPTAAASAAYNPKIQFWTSRGFAVVDVNYRGSTGYGRPYRDALKGGWGVTDVADCVAAARYLADRGLADPNRLAITGSSAGGYAVLCAVTFHDVFRAGASHYGISDLEALATDTHKFEKHYLDSLVGPYPACRDLYVARSPIHHVDRLAVPMAFFQGLEDKVVPPDQAERMVAAIAAKGLPVAYVPFAGERHGFRRAETIVAALEGELYFYGRVFGFTPADDLPGIPIRNLP